MGMSWGVLLLAVATAVGADLLPTPLPEVEDRLTISREDLVKHLEMQRVEREALYKQIEELEAARQRQAVILEKMYAAGMCS